MNILNNKALLRKQMRDKRRILDSVQKQQNEQVIINHIWKFLKQWNPKKNQIGLYYPMGSEASIMGLLNNENHHYCFFFPRIINQAMIFLPFISMDDCEKDDKNIPAPKVSMNIKASLDVIFVPLLGFTTDGYRLGQGGGFFDRYIHQNRKGKKKATFIGIGFELQKMQDIPLEAHDEMLDMIITEQTIYQCKR